MTEVISPGHPGPGGAVGADTRAAKVAAAKTIFKRSDTPFEAARAPAVVSEAISGPLLESNGTRTGGTEVMLVAEPGITTTDFLAVPFRFQVPPIDSLARTAAHGMASYTVLGGADGPQEFSRSEGAKLRTVSFRSMFLDWDPDFAVWTPDELEPQLAVAELESLCLNGVKMRLRIRNAELYDYDDVNMLVVCTQADAEEVAGEEDTRYLQLSFQEWNPTKAERKALQAKKGPWVHKIVPGDTLYRLSQTYYKTNTMWRTIAAANPQMSTINPSRDLRQWSSYSHRTSVRVPAKPGPVSAAAGAERDTQAIAIP